MIQIPVGLWKKKKSSYVAKEPVRFMGKVQPYFA